jgi:hypothetical protein
LQCRPWPPPYTGKVLRERAASWYHGVSPPSHQARLDSLVVVLKKLADRRLTAGCVLANLHNRRVVPLMERRLRIFEMSEDADPIALAELRLLREPFPRSYAATQAWRAIDLRSGRCYDVSLWALEMLPVGQLVSVFLGSPSCFASFSGCRCVLRFRPTPADSAHECRKVRAAHASVLRACARGATARAGAGGPQEGARRTATGAPGAEERGVPAA